MIKIKKTEQPKKKRKPYYILVFDYMIGDADGDTTKRIKLSVDNPFIERFVTLINKLKPLKGHWGIVFKEYEFERFYEQKQLSKKDFDFLKTLMFDSYEQDEEDNNSFVVDKKDLKYSKEFYDGIEGETEYSFLVFEGCTLYYYDEHGVKHNTYFEKEKND